MAPDVSKERINFIVNGKIDHERIYNGKNPQNLFFIY
jgi:hypothetical protein